MVAGYLAVCVGEADDADGKFVLRREVGFAAEGDEQVVEECEGCCERVVEELVEEGGRIERRVGV